MPPLFLSFIASSRSSDTTGKIASLIISSNLRDKWLSEQIDSRILTLIYARYIDVADTELLSQELLGSRYQTYFMRDHNLFNLI
ncbi:MAG: hypothetical protein K2P99_04090 [Burkholderiales bacterium]|nr:hypothetical protein [Burkholderiales bacterium]